MNNNRQDAAGRDRVRNPDRIRVAAWLRRRAFAWPIAAAMAVGASLMLVSSVAEGQPQRVVAFDGPKRTALFIF